MQTKPPSVEAIAISTAISFFERAGYRVSHISHGRVPEHAGLDLLIDLSGETQTIEVKGTSNEWQIPDLYSSEVTDGKLVADYLVLVYIKDQKPISLCKIPRDEFKADEFAMKLSYRISSKVKKSMRLEKYLQRL